MSLYWHCHWDAVAILATKQLHNIIIDKKSQQSCTGDEVWEVFLHTFTIMSKNIWFIINYYSESWKYNLNSIEIFSYCWYLDIRNNDDSITTHLSIMYKFNTCLSVLIEVSTGHVFHSLSLYNLIDFINNVEQKMSKKNLFLYWLIFIDDLLSSVLIIKCIVLTLKHRRDFFIHF